MWKILESSKGVHKTQLLVPRSFWVTFYPAGERKLFLQRAHLPTYMGQQIHLVLVRIRVFSFLVDF